MIIATGLSGSIGKTMNGVIDSEIRLEYSQAKMLSILRDFNPECMIHLGSPTNIKFFESLSESKKDDLIEQNLNLFRAFGKAGGKYFLFASSGHVYGISKSNEPFREDEETLPVSNYARFKLELEQKLQLEGEKFGVQIAICRVFSVFGPGMANHFLASRVLTGCRTQNFTSIRNGLDVRDFVTPGIVGRSLFQLASLRVEGIFNVCGGQGISVKEKVYKHCPEWPEDLIEEKYSGLPYLVGCPTKLRSCLKVFGA